jgi:chromosome segregation ATPase
MSEETTQHIPDGRSFEERVFARFDALAASIRGLDARLTSLEEKVDQRLKETRPIWEQVLVRLDSLEKGYRGIAKDVDYLKRKFRIFNEDILSWQNKQDDMEERVSKLESESAK